MKYDIISRAKKILDTESKAVREQIRHLDNNFIKSVELISSCTGRIVIMGVGKSGLIGRKIAATFSSLGIPAISVHPADLSHGDLGMLVHGDIVLVLSYSGESEELKKVFPTIREMGLKTILMAGRHSSILAKSCNLLINVNVNREACPFNLAPTSSTTAMLALGDALALCVGYKKGFKKEDFAKYHPGGNIGKKLMLTVAELMHRGRDNPVINEKHTVKETLFVMTKKRLGATSVIDSKGRLVGYFTDGDLRRKLQTDKNLLDRKIKEVMTANPKTITGNRLAVEAADMMKKYNCDNLPVIDEEGRPVGMIDERDLMSAGLI